MTVVGRPDHAVAQGHRVTTLELFFDLVFVYAITQVTGLLADHPTLLGLTQGLLVLMVLWWCWCCYAWLATTMRADVGHNRIIMLAAMTVMFLISLTIPESFDDLPGGLDGPLLFAGCYLAVRLLHIGAYALAGRGDRDLLSVLRRMSVPMLAGTALLATAALTHGALQLGLWAAALFIDYVGVFVTGGGSWRLESPQHFAERHGLIIIVALGESIVAIGIGIAGAPMSWLIVGTALGGLAISCCLWWMYFTVVAERSEAALARAQGRERAALARDGYTFLHLPMVAGIVLLALGLKKAMTYVADIETYPAGEALSGLPLWTLSGGVTLFVLAQVAFRLRTTGTWNVARIVLATGVLVSTPLLELLPASAAVGTVAACCAVLISYESLRHRSDDVVAEEPVPEYRD
jgi:low temperature requirement protein LtrA